MIAGCGGNSFLASVAEGGKSTAAEGWGWGAGGGLEGLGGAGPCKVSALPQMEEHPGAMPGQLGF